MQCGLWLVEANNNRAHLPLVRIENDKAQFVNRKISVLDMWVSQKLSAFHDLNRSRGGLKIITGTLNEYHSYSLFSNSHSNSRRASQCNANVQDQDNTFTKTVAVALLEAIKASQMVIIKTPPATLMKLAKAPSLSLIKTSNLIKLPAITETFFLTQLINAKFKNHVTSPRWIPRIQQMTTERCLYNNWNLVRLRQNVDETTFSCQRFLNMTFYFIIRYFAIFVAAGSWRNVFCYVSATENSAARTYVSGFVGCDKFGRLAN